MSNQKTQSFMANGRVQVYRHPTAGLLASVADIIRTIGVTEKDGLRGIVLHYDTFFKGCIFNMPVHGRVRRFMTFAKVPYWLAAYFPDNQIAHDLMDAFIKTDDEREEINALLAKQP